MKKFLSLGLAAILTAGIATSCKDDVLNSGDVNKGPVFEDDGRRVSYVAALTLPSLGGTRSATEEEPGDGEDWDGKTNSDAKDPSDYEYGYDYENTIQTILLVFANQDNEYVTHSKVTGITKIPSSGANGVMTTEYADLVVTGELNHNVLEAAYHKADGSVEGDEDGILASSQVVYVYAFCNYTARMLDRFENLAKGLEDTEEPGVKWYNWSGLVEEEASPAGFTPLTQNSIWSKNSFLMANAKQCKIKFPATIEDWDQYADKDKPFHVGENENGSVCTPIPVERVAARLDFKDGSKGVYSWEKRPNTYPIWVDANRNNVLGDEGENGDLNIISVQLNRMCLVNMGKTYYYLRRTSDDGLGNFNDEGDTHNVRLLGVEHLKNYIVDSDWDAKYNNKIEVADGSDNSYNYFNFPLYTTAKVEEGDVEGTVKYNRFGWYTDRIEEDFFENAVDDTWGADKQDYKGSSYKIWRYVTENTIPGKAAQQTKQSTGIVFKGRIVPGTHASAPNASDYMSQNVINAIKYINGESINVEGEDDPVTFNIDDAKNRTELTPDELKYIPYLYSYNNILYAGHEEIIEKANSDGNNGPLHQAVSNVLKNWKYDKATQTYKYKNIAGAADVPAEAADEYLTVEAWVNIKNNLEFPDKTKRKVEMTADEFTINAPASEITVYRPYNELEKDVKGNVIGDGWGYYCYYFYWNRHNDNGNTGLMGNMEFATVRNNVYKLSVDKINRLGHPRHRIFDPDPIEPDDPDEDPINYIQVNVKVLPWVVRVNKIEF